MIVCTDHFWTAEGSPWTLNRQKHGQQPFSSLMKPKLLSTDPSCCKKSTFADLQQTFYPKAFVPLCFHRSKWGAFFSLRSKMQSKIGGWPNPNPSEGYRIFKNEACMWAQCKLVKYIHFCSTFKNLQQQTCYLLCQCWPGTEMLAFPEMRTIFTAVFSALWSRHHYRR